MVARQVGAKMTKLRAVMVTGAAFLAVSAWQRVPAQAPARPLHVLAQMDAGKWELRSRDSGTVRQLCLGNRRNAVQLMHRDNACDWVVLEDAAASLTVQYTSRGHGYGRTHIRRETARLVQIETQGIANGVPFDERVEGRRSGDCAI